MPVSRTLYDNRSFATPGRAGFAHLYDNRSFATPGRAGFAHLYDNRSFATPGRAGFAHLYDNRSFATPGRAGFAHLYDNRSFATPGRAISPTYEGHCTEGDRRRPLPMENCRFPWVASHGERQTSCIPW